MKSLFNFLSSLIFLLWGTMISEAIANQKFLAINCSYNTFTPTNTYTINFSKLLYSLALKTTQNDRSNGYFTDIITDLDVASSNTTVYTQFFCRGDYSIDECKNCLTNAIRILSTRCPSSIWAHIWYRDCKVDYSSLDLFGFYDDSSKPIWFFKSNDKVSTRDALSMAAFVATTIAELAKQVASTTTDVDKIKLSSLGSGVKYFGTQVVNFTRNGSDNHRHQVTTLYEMVQCTPDLSVTDCNSCLGSMINQLSKCCTGRLGGRVVTRNCFIQYEAYPFYDISAAMKSDPTTSNATGHLLGKVTLNKIVAITVPTAIFLGLATLGTGLCTWKMMQNRYSTYPSNDDDFHKIESVQYDLETLKVATLNFSDNNMLGHGGFGSVYKGILQDGQQIAVKKLFKSTSKVEKEFKNEVEVLAKLHHRNLVKLLGFCLEDTEKLLVFEYVPNKSLDKLLFDIEEGAKLNWPVRFKIIVGIARGLLYLHEDSRHQIVHFDLKPGNILVDEEMSPKIADFGMARFFAPKQEHGGVSITRPPLKYSGIDPTHQSTRGGGGTIGYMAPEIAHRGQFSVKSDVYSYGVMILEIISGKRNSQFHLSGLAENLLSYAWIQWKAGTPLTFIDETLVSDNAFPSDEIRNQILMCIHLGLLCIQKDAKGRPTMKMIVHVFSNVEVEFKKWAGTKL